MPAAAPATTLDLSTLTLPEKMVEHIGYSNAALEKAAAVMRADSARRSKTAALIPQAVEALVSGERITDTPAQREKAAQMLADPEQAIQLLIKVATHRNTQEVRLGQPVSEKTAGANGRDPSHSLTSPHIGARTGHIKQSDVNFFQRLGLHAPTA